MDPIVSFSYGHGGVLSLVRDPKGNRIESPMLYQEEGDALIMSGAFQQECAHGVPERRVCGGLMERFGGDFTVTSHGLGCLSVSDSVLYKPLGYLHKMSANLKKLCRRNFQKPRNREYLLKKHSRNPNWILISLTSFRSWSCCSFAGLCSCKEDKPQT